MKKPIVTVLFLLSLSACEDASKTIDKAQASANKAVDSLQEKMETLDLNALNLEQFGDATNATKALIESIEEALHVDFDNSQAIEDAKKHISQAYRCVVDATSESTAQQLINKIKATISDEDVVTLIERGVNKAKAASACVI